MGKRDSSQTRKAVRFKAIHLIHKGNPALPAIELDDSGVAIFRSGNWRLSERTAKALIGGRIFFHRRQADPSFRGGTILNFEKVQSGKYAGRIVFIFSADGACEGIVTQRKGWAQVLKLIRE